MARQDSLEMQEDLQKLYWNYFLEMVKRYKANGLTGRLILDLQKGAINSIQNQEIIAGATVLTYHLTNAQV